LTKKYDISKVMLFVVQETWVLRFPAETLLIRNKKIYPNYLISMTTRT